ncbi:Uma2 family endonuclease [Candidatus Methylospira mobilis]|uniref:Uma2 family endonuclease n=1 Tax=Candidatus Methylospira mobilis TaxID=1808979 RepID=A0A5Q0BQ43_9GAMM|nr:Uma2 family endonuclease [Candidatus Methylospira mobilis]QFY44324.1 Uma2 family endonuclease [Candidatus Methylospira mobilis]WNV06245.1 Uma2 family endonuclease [Candidatus Methylospira mobilis]
MNAIVRQSDNRYTVTDYLSWNDDERWELIDGVAYNMSPAPAIIHQNIAGEMFVRLKEKLRGKPCQPFIAPVDVILSERDVVQPDVIVVCDPAKITEKNIQGAPDLVVEVLSPSTAARDLREKKALYQRAGVREYLVIDPSANYVQAWRLDNQQHFCEAEVYAADDVLPLHALDGFEIALSELFGLPEAVPVKGPPLG